MPEPGRKLSAVDGPAAVPGKRPAGRTPSSRGPWLLVALLGVLLVLCAVGLGMERSRSLRLEGRVAELGGELAATRVALEAHEARLDEVRGAVARLHALVQRDPVAPAPEPDAR